MPTMHQNTFGGRAPAGPAGGANARPQPLATIRGILLRGGMEEEGMGEEREGREEREGKEKKGKGNRILGAFPQILFSRTAPVYITLLLQN